MKPLAILTTAFAAGLFGATPMAQANPVADFYKDATVNLLIATPSGSGYDFEGRLVGRHIGKHIPGQPKIVPQNLPGGGGLRIANTLYNAAAQDGTNLGLVMNTTAMMQAISGPGVQYDVGKFNWIGAVSPATDSMAVWHTEKVVSIEDARKKTVVAAATGKGANSYVIPAAMNELLGTRFKIVTGYQGSPEMNAAMERGEAGARGTSWASWRTTKADWLRDKKLHVIAYVGPKPKDIPPGVPSLYDLVKSDDDRRVLEIVFSGTEFGRPFAMGPGVPAERVEAMRGAFMATMKDPAFLAEAAKLKVEVDPVSHTQMQALAGKLSQTPKNVAARAKALVQ